MSDRIILHSDLNCFYASVEMLLDPSLRGKAVAVCGSTEERHGIVLAKSELAKKAGVKTGQANWQARQACPNLIVVPPQYDEYLKFSKLVRSIYLRYTDLVEPYGMDECWLDVSGCRKLYGSGQEIAEQIRQTIKEEIGLTVSIGVSFNKIFAKLGSDMKKPDAVTVLEENNWRERIWPLPASDLLFVGRSTSRKLACRNVNTIGDIAHLPVEYMQKWFGKNGVVLWRYANGLDCSRIMHTEYESPMKSVGHGITCSCDLTSNNDVYQQFATQFIIDNPVAAVLLQMGLGKSVITLTAIHSLMLDRFDVHRVLVIAPLRVARDTWPAEIRKWDHLKGLTYSVAVGSEKERRAALMQETHIHIINRENVQWLIEKSGIPFEYDMIVIDELSSFKSHTAQRFKSLLKVRYRVSRIVGLTGTPSSNGLMDLFAQFRILDGGKRLGRFITHYRNEFFLPDRTNGMQVYSWKPRPGAEDEIYRRISDITISMKSADYLKMPECVINRVPAWMSDYEEDVYDELRKQLVTQLGGAQIDAKNAASLSGKLCQLANGAVYTDDGSFALFHDRKLDVLEDLIEAANGNPVLVAYWFKHDLDRIRLRFPGVRELKSSRDLTDWNVGKIPVALIHPASAGHGLNLQAGGSTLIWFGLTWSLELYQQTNARLWRQGQQADTVVIHHIITQGTIDEQIMTALERKDKAQTALIDAVKAQLEV